MVKAYFSCTTNLTHLISGFLKKAQRCIHMAMYTLTNKELIDNLKTISKQKISMSLILDKEQLYSNKDVLFDLINSDIKIKTIGSVEARMHHKFIVIDEFLTITGSFNWTYQASISNHENVIITNDLKVASDFLKEFRRIITLIDSNEENCELCEIIDNDINKIYQDMVIDAKFNKIKSGIVTFDSNGKIIIP